MKYILTFVIFLIFTGCASQPVASPALVKITNKACRLFPNCRIFSVKQESEIPKVEGFAGVVAFNKDGKYLFGGCNSRLPNCDIYVIQQGN